VVFDENDVSNRCMLPIPCPHTEDGHVAINTSFIKIGSTTKDDIVLRFGGVFYANDNETVLYHECIDYEMYVIIGWIALPGLPITDTALKSHYYVEIEFDKNEAVKDLRVRKEMAKLLAG